MQKSSILSDLKHELKQTKDRLFNNEIDSHSLEEQNKTLNEKNVSLVKSYEKQIENLNIELDREREQFERKLFALNQINEREVEKMRMNWEIEKETLINNYDTKINTERASFEEKIQSIELVFQFKS